MRFDIVTIFPNIFDSYFNESLFKRARKNGLLDIKVHNLRGYTEDKHQVVDDSPYGGGPGMVLKAEPIAKAVASLKRQTTSERLKSCVILFSTRGEKLDQKTAKRLAKYDRLILICGRYEGIDERVAKYIADEEISIGDYILSGGELPAMVLVEAVSRQLSGFIGKRESLEEIKGSYPVYTRPETLTVKGKKRKVPPVLLGGDHKKIQEWRDG